MQRFRSKDVNEILPKWRVANPDDVSEPTWPTEYNYIEHRNSLMTEDLNIPEEDKSESAFYSQCDYCYQQFHNSYRWTKKYGRTQLVFCSKNCLTNYWMDVHDSYQHGQISITTCVQCRQLTNNPIFSEQLNVPFCSTTCRQNYYEDLFYDL